MVAAPHRQLPLIQAYEELAAQYPRGLAELAPLPVELSGEVQEVMCNEADKTQTETEVRC